MRRALPLALVSAALVAAAWLSTEHGPATPDPRSRIAALVVLAVLPVLVRPWWGRALAAVAAVPVALGLAFQVSLLDARPFDDDRDAVGPILARLRDGVLGFYDVGLPFDRAEEPLMHGAVLAAVFAFSLLVALALAARRPLLASVLLVAGTAWPATMVDDGNRLVLGGLLLAAVLALLAFGGPRPTRSVRPAALAALVLVLASLAAATQPAVAKGEFLSWQDWDFYDEPADPVGVDYVWDSNYDGIEFPDDETEVLRITGPERGLYWRATTLDEFDGVRWREELGTIGAASQAVQLTGDPFLPPRAQERDRWVRADVEVLALRDDHLVGPATPVFYDPGTLGVVEYRDAGVAVVPEGLEREDRYTVWAFAPRPSPQQLSEVRPLRYLRNTLESDYLEVMPGYEAPPFGTGEREQQLAEWLEGPLAAYAPLYRAARSVVGDPDNVYAAVIALEAWFRSGEFTYDERPRRVPGAPPLVSFVTETRAGYCQHFSNAMALMLRYLGIPARVAVGFTSGSYEQSTRTWTVTDHDAHAWVEVYFPGHGWLPFDPTPGRGQLAGSHSVSSPASNAGTIQRLIEQSQRAGGDPSVLGRFAQGATGSPLGGDLPGDLGGGGGGGTRETGESLLKLLLLVGAGLLAALALAKQAVRGSRRLVRDPRRVAEVCRRDLVDFAIDQGVRIPRSATLAELEHVLARELYVDAGPLVAALAEARYARPERARDGAVRARRELRSLKRLLRRRLTKAERARGFLSLRSLGFGASA